MYIVQMMWLGERKARLWWKWVAIDVNKSEVKCRDINLGGVSQKWYRELIVGRTKKEKQETYSGTNGVFYTSCSQTFKFFYL